MAEVMTTVARPPLLIPIENIVGGIVSQYLTVAFFALIIYEYAITFDDEVKHFWRGPWSISQALFFFNRYFPIISNFISLLCQTLENPSDEFCGHGIRATFVLNTLGIAIIQAILITRVWFLFPGDKYLQFALIFSFTLSLCISMFFVSVAITQLRVFPLAPIQKVFGNQIIGCHAARPADFWRIYLPSLVLHTGLYGLTVHQAIASPHLDKTAGIRWKLLADGGVFYFIVLCSVSLTSIGSFLINTPQINVPAIFSPIILTTTSIATSRIMFSLRSIITSDEDSLKWVNTTNGPAMPLPTEPSSGTFLSFNTLLPFRSKSNKSKPPSVGGHQRQSSSWSQKQLIITPSPTLKLDTADVLMDEKHASVITNVEDLSAAEWVVTNRYYARDAESPEPLWQARYDSYYDEEKGLDDAYKRAMRTGRVFF